MIRLSTTAIDPETVLAEILTGELGDTQAGIATFKKVASADPQTVLVDITVTHGDRTTVGTALLAAPIWEHIQAIMADEN